MPRWMGEREQHERFFKNIANDHKAWIRTAESLIDSVKGFREATMKNHGIMSNSTAEATFHKDFMSIQLMHYSFAIECLLKAVFVKDGGEFVNDGDMIKMPGLVRHHDLIELSEHIGIDTEDKHRRDLLYRLTVYNQLGRYPTPMRFEDIAIGEDSRGGFGPPRGWYVPTDYELLDTLLEDLLSRLAE